MALFDDKGLNFFGLTIVKQRKPDEDKSASFALPQDDEGASVVAAANNAAYYGVYFDTNALVKDETQAIQKCREVSLYPEVDIAVQDIVNEAIPHEDDSPIVELILDELEFSDSLKEEIQEEFDYCKALLKFEKLASDVFRRWYVDGRLYYHVIVDKNNLKRGITELRLIDATKMRKVKEVKKGKSPSGVEVIESVEEYFVYNEQGFGQTQSNNNQNIATSIQGIKLSTDAVIYCPSGYLDGNTNSVLSYLQKAIRPANQLRMLEDATVVYFIARAPERRIFYVDVGNLPKLKAEQYMKEIMNRYRNKMVYDARTGEIRDDKKYMSMLEDFWMPRRDNSKGTQIETLPGATNITGQLDAVDYFQKKLYQSLNIPVSRLQPDTGFSLGRSTEVSRDEVKFQKFIDKLRRRFGQLLLDTLKTHLILKGICNNLEWDEVISDKIKLRFQRDNFFDELKEQEMLTSRMALLPQVDPYLGKYFSKKWVQKTLLRLTDDDIEKMDEEIEEEKGDPTAQPSMQGMPMDGSGMIPPGDDGMGSDMGGYPFQDPNAPPQDTKEDGQDATKQKQGAK